MEVAINIPEDWIEEVTEQPSQLSEQREISTDENKVWPIRHRRSRSILGVAASLALISAVLPDLNRTVAYALQNLPAAGAYFRLVTVRDYTLAGGEHTVTMQVGKIQPESQDGTQTVRAEESVEEMNAEIQHIMEEQITAFWEEMEHEGHSNLEISTQVVTDGDTWYLACLIQIRQDTDSTEANWYFTIRKSDGRLIQLSDLSAPGNDYVKTLNEGVKQQMQAEMTGDSGRIFFLGSDIPKDDFKEIKKDQNSYVSSESYLVTCSNEGEVTPMSEGSLQLVMPEDLSDLAI